MLPLRPLHVIAPKESPFAIRKMGKIQQCLYSFSFLLLGGFIFSAPVRSEPTFNQGIALFERGEWAQSIKIFQQLSASEPSPFSSHQEKALQYIAQAQWNLGQSNSAIQSLESLAQHHQRRGDTAQWGRILTQQAQYLLKMGNLNQARRLLCHNEFSNLQDCRPQSAIQLAIMSRDSAGQIAALGSLGVLLAQNSELDLSQQVLQTALFQSQQSLNPLYRPQLLNSLGQTHLRRAAQEQNYARLSQQANDSGKVRIFQQRSQASLNQAIQILEENHQDLAAVPPSQSHLDNATHLIQAYQYQSGLPTNPQIEALFQKTQQWLAQQPLSQHKLYAASRLVKLRTNPTFLTAEPLTSSACPPLNTPSPVSDISQIIQMARRLKNRDVEAYSLGLLGYIAHCQNQQTSAQQYTEQAILLSQRLDHRYQWEWQLGKIVQAQGKSSAAIKVYEQAVLTLEKVRGDIAASDRDVQLDLQANVEDLYRELAYLQLQQLSNAPLSSNALTQTVLTNLDRLRLVELQNYLASDCEFPAIQSELSAQHENTAVIRTVLFADRMAIALTYSDHKGQLQSHLHWVHHSKDQINAVINQFRFDLEKRSDLTQKYRTGAQTLYDWIIRPLENQLQATTVDTLVFINDGLLRSIPMATLHDGQSFLVESYAIGNATYWTSSHAAVAQKGNETVAFGLTEPAKISQYAQVLSFAPLPGVKQELAGIQATLKKSQIRINQAFSPRLLRKTLTQASPQILHLATHARFGVDPRETFLITGKKNHDITNSTNITVNMLDLYQLIRSLQTPIRLLALTGCETAVGNERDALGITGVALQAGVETVMASLWQIDDQATGKIVPTFYQNLARGLPKAKALQQAQISWLRTQNRGRQTHPGYWAPLILVGDWR